MLEKVTDIKFNSQMAENKNGYKKNRFTSSSAYNKSNHFDSINISPAFHFMSKLNFKILNIFNSSANKYEIVVELNNYIFDVIIDLNLFFDKREIQFKISPKENGDRKNIFVFLKIIYDGKNSSFDVSTNQVNKFFQRINDSGFGDNSALFDHEILGFLLDGIEDDILFELRNISKAVIHFIEKLYEIKIVERLENNKSFLDDIKIQLIKSGDFLGIQKSE